MNKFDKYITTLQKFNSGYRFSWQISTEIIEEQLSRKPYWLDIGARDNIRLKIHPQAALGVGLDIEAEGEVFTDTNNCFCLGSVYAIPVKADSFEFVASRFVFEHLANPEEALSEVARVLKPGGVFLMETTNKNNPLLIISRMLPLFLKRIIFGKLFKDNPSGTYKTYYRMNAVSTYRNLDLSSIGLVLADLHVVNDVICDSKLLFTISFQFYKLLKLLGLKNLYGNILAVFRKI